ncbi:adenosylmethionine--8-amino-7-oxononanoate transaminase [Flavobacterium orientale]|uniref:Adenosylmethionine-8-amino-7-oxononanoate aminotransferase n=1 Tax=Flavobacterium orientale TaxID=1756020 RepID=A0A916XX24_9FLAO|nr:adenosylmethionine--8-amino-7-oxononanoate transaminase [Flavobacterium orientale]GGD18439.1 adenosylmethionine--8-amino-7-oxononanoate aminotransferase BioA [Flavobacterium orientale]
MTLSQKDQLYNWHPYTQHQTTGLLPAIVKGDGVYLWDENGKQYLDAISSWWVNPFGHSNPVLAQAIYKQLTTLEHVLFGGFTNKPAVELAEKLLAMLPSNQKKLFYSDNGSTAVEIAIKAALQYFYNKGEKRTKIIAFENGFHGDTFGAMAASGISFFTEAFQGSMLEVVRIPIPTAENDSLTVLNDLLQTNEFAAFIFEPLVQGAAGMVMYEASELDKLIGLCKKNKVFTIADEIMTGFGKTGKTFACDYLTEQPDMICLSKALTGGTIPMAVTSFSQQIFDRFLSENVNKALFHGHTFTGNPTGCAAALAAISLLESEEMQSNIQRIAAQHLAFQKQIKAHPKVKTTRVLGIIFAMEIASAGDQSYYGSLRNQLYDFFIEQGIILRPVGNVVYILPPFITSNEQLEIIYTTLSKALEIV